MKLVEAILAGFILILLAVPGMGFACYQCNSTLDTNCQEIFDHENPNNPVISSQCMMYDAKYCIKVTGLWGGIVGTHRFCSARDLGQQCQDMRFPDHDRLYRACVFTCSSDGCNGASSIFSTLSIIITVAILISVIRVL
ncbi:hypothetical protein CHS0354_005642 [Potamilus streckersoni]|uniref:Protein sleepless n=1 Tax=Potamilus streckersoni TaxID=2493646 RepID=A0AAE0S0F9_9BIVA|nr:hypothetical protein CHS0354_005642 [Potamilus streckersoni]